MIVPVELDSDAAPQIAAFTRVACPYDLLSTGSVERSVFAEPDPQIVLGVFDGGLDAVGAAVVRADRGFIKFIAVHPRVQLRGIGTELLTHLESFCEAQGAKTVELGNSAPFYVVPGVDVRATEAVCFFHARGYRRAGEAVNQRVRLAAIPDPELPCYTADADALNGPLAWVKTEYPHWVAELERGLTLGTCVAHEDLGFACYDVNRDGWFGPMATRAGSGTKGVGTATLLAALQRMRARGYEHADIAWSGPLLFYMKAVGARISRVFWTYQKTI